MYEDSMLKDILENTKDDLTSLEYDLQGDVVEDETVEQKSVVTNEEVEENEEASTDLGDGDDELDDEDIEPSNKAFAKMRIEKKQMSDEMAELRNQIAELSGFVKGNQSVQQQYEEEKKRRELEAQEKQFAESEPDPIDDPVGYKNWLRESIRKEYEPTINELKEKSDAYSQQAQIQSARDELKTIEKSYSKIDIDYSNAKDYLWENYAGELKLSYPNATDDQIQTHIQQVELESAAQAYNNGVNPAKYFKELAIQRGYKKTTVNPKAAQENRKRSTSFVGQGGATARAKIQPDEWDTMTLRQLMDNSGDLEKDLGLDQY